MYNFKLENNTDVSSWKAYLDSGEVNFEYDETQEAYKVKIDDISAHKLSELYTIKIKDSNSKTLVTVDVRALSYVYSVLKTYSDKNYTTDTKGECNAMSAIYKYYDATMAYRKAKGYSD